ncbi:MAG: hypothetical protein UT84_C0003G0034 [Candidatus Curtissbacteria bacterium GW2011_GWA1_40_16]|uniref:Uncharacterized protein n=1 Tax=Candidatus Curtissbacteria bacterium GW2011_GWA1_40_16 TaxID=1618405 RepID=A0A0G0RE98_9BACT|nr:MAG: hypothetical protein UT84_C0003G0034 [Candidatus Curtissbacteria bacterium GW2011_GWA1_40_16]
MDIVVVVCAAFLVLYVATKGIMGSFPQVSGFWLPVDKKVDRETLGQASYADHLKKITLPTDVQCSGRERRYK